MKLNIDCVRNVLLFLEDNLELNKPINFKDVIISNFNQDEIKYTILKLNEAKYIEVKSSYKLDGDIARNSYVTTITWNGHQFLDTIRDDTIFNNTKKQIFKTVSSVSIQVFSTLATKILLSTLGIE